MRIHYISPYRADKNIGLAVNDAIDALNYSDDDWIVHTDHDTLFLLPDTKAHIEIILQGTPFDVLGCMTNRIRSAEQLVARKFNEDANILTHVQIAQDIWGAYGAEVVSANGVMAAFMLCFRVSAWKVVGGFRENAINFDSLFDQDVRAAGLRVGLMKGVYVWHSYRLLSPHPKNDCSHLIK